MSLLHRLQQIAAKLESSEGVAESLAAADADLTVYDVEFEPAIEKVKRDPARRYMTPLPSVVGKQYGRLSFSVEVKSSGALATAPSWGKLLKACGMQEAALVTIAIGSITSGPFVPGDVVTGGTSNATGLVIDRVATGASVLHLVVLSGTFQNGEVLTGSVSGATATTGGTATASQGWNYRPTSTTLSTSSLTLGFFHDGLKKVIYGARGNVRGTGGNGALGMLRFELEGVYGGVTDVALLSNTLESQVPVTFLDVGLYLDAYQADFATLEFDLGAVRQQYETAQAAKGSKFVRITGRAPTVTLDPYAALVAGFDWFGKLASSNTSFLRAAYGTSPNKVVLAFPKLSYEAVRQATRGDFQTLGVTLAAVAPTVSTGDNEVLISVV